MIDVHLVTGFLGSGKTSLMKHLLDPRHFGGDPGVVISDAADENVDGAILEREHPELAPRIIRLVEGPDASHLAGGMVPHVVSLLARGVDRVFIETSGVATASRILAELSAAEELRGRARIGPTITLVDALAYEWTRRHFGEVLDSQLLIADLLVLNKRDRVSKDELARIRAELLRALPHTRVVDTYESQVPGAVLRESLASERTPAIARLGPFGDDGVRTLVYRNDAPAGSQVAFGHNLLNLPVPVARVKGVLRVQGGTLLMSGVPGQLDWFGRVPDRPTCVLFIGRFDIERLRREVDAIYPLTVAARPPRART